MASRRAQQQNDIHFIRLNQLFIKLGKSGTREEMFAELKEFLLKANRAKCDLLPGKMRGGRCNKSSTQLKYAVEDFERDCILEELTKNEYHRGKTARFGHRRGDVIPQNGATQHR
jgi:hypothetical protein